MDAKAAKREAARAALEYVETGMLLGIGSGSTAEEFVRLLAARVAEGLRIVGVPTSERTAALCRETGVPLSDLDETPHLDLAIDGADEIDPQFRAIKGGGGAMLREKIVASAARRMVVVADGSKRVERLGTAPLPVEVLPFARSFVAAELRRLGAEPVLRRAGADPYLTDQNNIVLDCAFAALDAPDELAATLAAIPGVLGHGLFLCEVDAAYIAADGSVERIERH